MNYLVLRSAIKRNNKSVVIALLEVLLYVLNLPQRYGPLLNDTSPEFDAGANF